MRHPPVLLRVEPDTKTLLERVSPSAGFSKDSATSFVLQKAESLALFHRAGDTFATAGGVLVDDPAARAKTGSAAIRAWDNLVAIAQFVLPDEASRGDDRSLLVETSHWTRRFTSYEEIRSVYYDVFDEWAAWSSPVDESAATAS